MNDLPCEVVRDLLPSYVDGLTSEATNKLVDGHIETCAPCRAALDAMRAPEAEPEQDVAGEPKEIDYLKKNRRHNRAVVLRSIAGALLLAAAVLFVRTFVIGRELNSVLPHDIRVDGSSCSMKLSCTDSLYVITGASLWEDEDGVLWVEAKGTPPSFLHRDNIDEISGDFEKPIHQVRMGERIFWDDGLNISEQVSGLYATRHDYVGDMPANARTANALELSRYLGVYQNELLTAQPPYAWKLLLQEDVPGSRRALREREMEAFGYVLLGLVGNLEEVCYEYTVDGAEAEKTVTAADATALLGRDIKDCGESPRLLQELMQVTGVAQYGFDAAELHITGNASEGFTITQ